MGIIKDFNEFRQNKSREVAETKEEKDFNMTVIASGTPQNLGSSKKYFDANIEWVYRNIQARATATSQIEFELYKVKKNNEPERVLTHELLETLYHANNFQSKTDLIDNTIQHLDITGRSFWYIERASDNPKAKPKAFWPLNPINMTIYPAEDIGADFIISKYEYKLPDGGTQIFMPWQILDFKYTDPSDPLKSKSIISAAAQTIEIDYFASEFNRRFFMNSARPDGMLITDQRLQKETVERLRKQWNAKFGGVGNNSKIAVLENGLKYEQLQMSQRDMDFLEQQKWTRNKIMSIFGNTPIVLGIVEDVNRANAQASEAYWKEHTIKPLMQKLCDYLNEFMVPIYGDDLFLTFKDPVPRDEQLLVDELRDLTNKVYTYNEARALKGLPEVEGGDIIYQPINLSPMGTSQAPDTQGTQGKMIKLKSKGKSKDILKRDLTDEVFKLRNRNLTRNKKLKKLEHQIDKIALSLVKAGLHKKVEPVKKYINPESYATKEKLHKALLNISSKYEKKFEDTLVVDIYPKIETDILVSLGIKETSLFDEKKYKQYIADSFEPLMSSLMKEEVDEMLSYIDATVPSTERDAEIMVKAHATALLVAGSVVATIAKKVNDVKKKEELAVAIKKLENTQAKAVSITEVSRAVGIGTLIAFKLGGVKYKEWFTALDERVCPFCAEMEGRILKAGEDYFKEGDKLVAENLNQKPVELEISFGDVTAPPLHTSCRCTLSPSFSAKAQRNLIVEKNIIHQVDEEAITEKIKEGLKSEIPKRVERDSIDEEALAEDVEETLIKVREVINGQNSSEKDSE